MRILMICLGNICRSPMAEGILKKKIKERGLSWFVDSAGTGAWHIDEAPDSRSIYTASLHGIDISERRARQFKPGDIERFDLVLTMDHSNYREITRYATTREQQKKVKLIMEFVKPGNPDAVPDPYWDDNGFEKVFQMLDAACDKLIESLNNKQSI